MKDLNPPITCYDGTTVSIQASAYHYCKPREDVGPYTHVEIGSPSVTPHAALMEFAEDPDNPTGTVYGYVPISVVDNFLFIHGGIKDGQLP